MHAPAPRRPDARNRPRAAVTGRRTKRLLRRCCGRPATSPLLPAPTSKAATDRRRSPRTPAVCRVPRSPGLSGPPPAVPVAVPAPQKAAAVCVPLLGCGLRRRDRARGLRNRFGCGRRWICGWKRLMRRVWEDRGLGLHFRRRIVRHDPRPRPLAHLLGRRLAWRGRSCYRGRRRSHTRTLTRQAPDLHSRDPRPTGPSPDRRGPTVCLPDDRHRPHADETPAVPHRAIKGRGCFRTGRRAKRPPCQATARAAERRHRQAAACAARRAREVVRRGRLASVRSGRVGGSPAPARAGVSRFLGFCFGRPGEQRRSRVEDSACAIVQNLVFRPDGAHRP
jgi:hypothetical protein